MNNKVIFSLEDWDSIIDYYRPNASSKTWYLKELGKMTIPLMWGDWVIYDENNNLVPFVKLKNIIQPSELSRISEYLTKDEIEDNTHIYLINVHNPSFFEKNKEIGFSCISEEYKDDVRNNKCTIVILHSSEGYSGRLRNNDLEIIESWRIKENFSDKSIYYISGNLICDNIAKQRGVKFKCLPISIFDAWISNYINNESPVSFEPIDDKNLYLSYNRQPRLHRILLIYELIKNKVFDRGLISLNKPWNQPMQFLKDIEIQKFIFENTPFNIDSSIDLKYNLACNIQLEDYKKTFISLVTETLVDKGTLFLSEKIWKPIIIGHPFIVYGSQFTLRYLKELGYKTFDKWIDESYDEQFEEDERCYIIVREIIRLSKLSIEEMKKMREEMYDICYYNKNHFNMLHHKNWKDGVNITLENYFLDIWEKRQIDMFNFKKEIYNKIGVVPERDTSIQEISNIDQEHFIENKFIDEQYVSIDMDYYKSENEVADTNIINPDVVNNEVINNEVIKKNRLI